MFYKNPIFWLLVGAFAHATITGSFSTTIISLGFMCLYYKCPVENKTEVKLISELDETYNEIESSRARLSLQQLRQQERMLAVTNEQEDELKNSTMVF